MFELTPETQELIIGYSYLALERIIAIAVIVVVAEIVINLINKILSRTFELTKFDQTLEKFVHKTTILLLWIVTLGIVLIYLGIPVESMVVSFGVGSFIIGFALKDTLNNLAAGVMILLNKPFKLKDDVEIAGKRGFVRTISMASTTLQTKGDDKIMIPNSVVWGNPIINYTDYKKAKSKKR